MHPSTEIRLPACIKEVYNQERKRGESTYIFTSFIKVWGTLVEVAQEFKQALCCCIEVKGRLTERCVENTCRTKHLLHRKEHCKHQQLINSSELTSLRNAIPTFLLPFFFFHKSNTYSRCDQLFKVSLTVIERTIFPISYFCGAFSPYLRCSTSVTN